MSCHFEYWAYNVAQVEKHIKKGREIPGPFSIYGYIIRANFQCPPLSGAVPPPLHRCKMPL